jgi:omega-6 fatty acid desaturase (delta-12 desaturase)
MKRSVKSFRAKSDLKAAVLCVFDIGVFVAGLVTVIVAPSVWVKLAAGLIMGIWIARLFIIGHDACHQAFFENRRLNRWVGRLVFMPSMTAYSLWEAGHNLGHHVYTNLRGYDYIWTPLTKESFDELTGLQRALERFYRSGFGHWAYYGVELWWKKLVFPSAAHIATRSSAFTTDSATVTAFGVAWVGLLIGAALVTGQSIIGLVVLGFALPFFVWNLLMGAVIYFHHTHPDIIWYGDLDEWEADRDGIRGTVLITFPFKLGRILNNIMEHPAHHLDVRIPLYNIEGAQAELNRSAEGLIEQPLTWNHIRNCTRRCKLYDYEARRWTDFNGTFTSEAGGGEPTPALVPSG